MSDLYETDILVWSEEQAVKLRRLAATDHSNTDSPDWPNIIEEIEDVGGSAPRAVKSLLIQAFLHDLKAEAWPMSRDVPLWRAEARGLRSDAADVFTPSMRQRINVHQLFAKALYRMPDAVDGVAPLPVLSSCPATLEELLSVP